MPLKINILTAIVKLSLMYMYVLLLPAIPAAVYNEIAKLC